MNVGNSTHCQGPAQISYFHEVLLNLARYILLPVCSYCALFLLCIRVIFCTVSFLPWVSSIMNLSFVSQDRTDPPSIPLTVFHGCTWNTILQYLEHVELIHWPKILEGRDCGLAIFVPASPSEPVALVHDRYSLKGYALFHHTLVWRSNFSF